MVKQLMSQIKAVGGYFPKPNPKADPHAVMYDPNNLSAGGDGEAPESSGK